MNPIDYLGKKGAHLKQITKLNHSLKCIEHIK